MLCRFIIKFMDAKDIHLILYVLSEKEIIKGILYVLLAKKRGGENLVLPGQCWTKNNVN